MSGSSDIKFVEELFDNPTARIITVFVIVLLVLWILGRKGYTYYKHHKKSSSFENAPANNHANASNQGYDNMESL